MCWMEYRTKAQKKSLCYYNDLLLLCNLIPDLLANYVITAADEQRFGVRYI